jgi:hypothetical protein
VDHPLDVAMKVSAERVCGICERALGGVREGLYCDPLLPLTGSSRASWGGRARRVLRFCR